MKQATKDKLAEFDKRYSKLKWKHLAICVLGWTALFGVTISAQVWIAAHLHWLGWLFLPVWWVLPSLYGRWAFRRFEKGLKLIADEEMNFLLRRINGQREAQQTEITVREIN
jgi:hypothetical protein